MTVREFFFGLPSEAEHLEKIEFRMTRLHKHFLFRGDLVRRIMDTCQRWWKYRKEDRDPYWMAERNLKSDLRAAMTAEFDRNGITEIEI